MPDTGQLTPCLIRPLPIQNSDSLPCPPFALCLITGVTADGLFTVTRPTADNQTKLIVINGPAIIPPGQNGAGSLTFPVIAAYDEDQAIVPALGDEWGAVADSWYLTAGKTGFTIFGSASLGLVNVALAPTSTTPETASLRVLDLPRWTAVVATNPAFTAAAEWTASLLGVTVPHWLAISTGNPIWSTLTPTISVIRTTTGGSFVAEVQEVTLEDSPTGGTWGIAGQVNTGLPFNASAANVQAQINAALGAGIVTVTGTGPYVLTWLAVGMQTLVAADGSLLTRTVPNWTAAVAGNPCWTPDFPGIPTPTWIVGGAFPANTPAWDPQPPATSSNPQRYQLAYTQRIDPALDTATDDELVWVVDPTDQLLPAGRYDGRYIGAYVDGVRTFEVIGGTDLDANRTQSGDVNTDNQFLGAGTKVVEMLLVSMNSDLNAIGNYYGIDYANAANQGQWVLKNNDSGLPVGFTSYFSGAAGLYYSGPVPKPFDSSTVRVSCDILPIILTDAGVDWLTFMIGGLFASGGSNHMAYGIDVAGSYLLGKTGAALLGATVSGGIVTSLGNNNGSGLTNLSLSSVAGGTLGAGTIKGRTFP